MCNFKVFQKKMNNIKVIRSKAALSSEDLLNIKGGLRQPLQDGCTCDCWISNTNEEGSKATKLDRL